MSFPNFEGKHAQDAFFSPQEWVVYFKQSGFLPDFDIPQGVIFCYQKALLKHILAHEEAETFALPIGNLYLLKSTSNKIAISSGFGIGAPAVSTVFEELIALGTSRFISIGSAGGLQEKVEIGDIVLCDKAIRDEGVSHHYLAPDKYAYPSPELTAQLRQTFEAQGTIYTTGPTWTIDAPYRETVAEARHYQAEGVYTVEMEAAALFAVAQVRGVKLASAFTISDSLAELSWKPQFRASETEQGLVKLYNAARATLLDPTDAK